MALHPKPKHNQPRKYQTRNRKTNGDTGRIRAYINLVNGKQESNEKCLSDFPPLDLKGHMVSLEIGAIVHRANLAHP